MVSVVNQVSRYRDIGPTQVSDALDPADVPPLAAEMRKTFDSEKTMPKAWRKQQLRQMIRMVELISIALS